MLHACVSLLQRVQDGTLGCGGADTPISQTHTHMRVVTLYLDRRERRWCIERRLLTGR